LSIFLRFPGNGPDIAVLLESFIGIITMCNPSCVTFVGDQITKNEIAGKTVIEVGSLDVNGTIRPIIEPLGPSSYVGVDIINGPGVDEICDAGRLVERFGEERFDCLISTELLEHVRDWRAVISNFKRVIKPGGTLVVTTRSRGFPYHAYPYDFWRYELSDMKAIFADCTIEGLVSDSKEPGVFLKVSKPLEFTETDTEDIKLYSIIRGRRIHSIGAIEDMAIKTRARLRRTGARVLPGFAKRRLKDMLRKQRHFVNHE